MKGKMIDSSYKLIEGPVWGKVANAVTSKVTIGINLKLYIDDHNETRKMSQVQ